MKSVNELGISMMPWEIADFCDGHIGVAAASGRRVAEASDTASARLIAAAPELYEALYNAIQTTCDGCDYENCEEECKDCHRHWWRKVLAKAAGEEENNGL